MVLLINNPGIPESHIGFILRVAKEKYVEIRDIISNNNRNKRNLYVVRRAWNKIMNLLNVYLLCGHKAVSTNKIFQ